LKEKCYKGNPEKANNTKYTYTYKIHNKEDTYKTQQVYNSIMG